MKMMLLYLRGPHDGEHREEADLPLQHGDCVRCDCHEALYEFCGLDQEGRYLVKHRPEHGLRISPPVRFSYLE